MSFDPGIACLSEMEDMKSKLTAQTLRVKLLSATPKYHEIAVIECPHVEIEERKVLFQKNYYCVACGVMVA
jgi:hypothetical protein